MLTNYHATKVLVEDRQRELVASAEAARARRTGRRTFGRWFNRQSASQPVAVAATLLRLAAARRPDTAPAGRTPAGVEGHPNAA